MKSPKPIVAGALVAGGLLFTTAAAALTLPDEASDTAKKQVGALVTGAEAADERRQDDVDRDTETDTDTDTDTEVETVETDTDDTGDVEDGERPVTHGSVVSDFASGEAQELEGRERGQAIARLAQTNGDADDDANDEEDGTREVDADDDDVDDTDDGGSAGRQRAAEARQGR